MIKNLFPLTILSLILFTISCSKVKVVPAKIATNQDTTKITDTSKTSITLPKGVATVYISNLTQWLISMHSDVASTGVESYPNNIIRTDGAGNIYILFNFYGTIDLDPGSGILTHSSYAIDKVTLAKYTSSGNLLWAKTFESNGSVLANALRVDPAGNVYCSLHCPHDDTYVKFDQTSYILKETEGSNLILKFNSSGSTQWVNELTCTTMPMVGYNSIADIAVDAQGRVYISTSFMDTLSIFGATTNTITAPDIGGNVVHYVVIICDNTGHIVSSKVLFHTSYYSPDLPVSRISIDNNGNIYLSGHIQELTSIPTTQIGTIDYGAQIIAKYDKNWNWLWVRGDPNNTYFNLQNDAAGNLYTLETPGFNTLVSKIAPDGSLTWSKNIQTNINSGQQSLNITTSGDVLVACNSVINRYTDAGQSINVSKYDTNGNLRYSKILAGYVPILEYSSEYSVAADGIGNVNLIGFFNQSLKYFGDNTDPVYPTSDQNISFFIAHFPDKP